MDNKCVAKLLETVAFSNGCICSVELIQWEHTHFHPSGEITPSKEDIEVTNTLVKCGVLMDIQVLDHVIIGRDKFYSFFNHGLMPKSNDKKLVFDHTVGLNKSRHMTWSGKKLKL